MGNSSGSTRLGAEQVHVLRRPLHQAVRDQSVTAGQRKPVIASRNQRDTRDLGLERVDTHASRPRHVRTGAPLVQHRVTLLPRGAHNAWQVQLGPVPYQGVPV